MNIIDCDFHDGMILSVSLLDEHVEILFEQWDCKQFRMSFGDYWRIKSFNPIGPEIDRMDMKSYGATINEVKKYIIDDGGAENEVDGLNNYLFLDSSDAVIFEIVAREVKVKALTSDEIT